MKENIIGGIETKDIEYVLKVINEAYSQFNMAESDLDYCDKKTQDILHELELVDHSYHETAKLSKELRDIRRRRRIDKDTMELLDPIFKWRSDYIGAINKLTNVLGSMRKIDEKHKNKVYYYRADANGEMIK